MLALCQLRLRRGAVAEDSSQGSQSLPALLLNKAAAAAVELRLLWFSWRISAETLEVIRFYGSCLRRILAPSPMGLVRGRVHWHSES